MHITCPNCNEGNTNGAKFCAKCRMVLTYDAYNETLEKQQEKESEIQRLREKYEQDMKAMNEKMQMLTVHKGKLEMLEEKMDELDRRLGLV